MSASTTSTLTPATGSPSYAPPSLGLEPWTTVCWIVTKRWPSATPSACAVTVMYWGRNQLARVKSSVTPVSEPFS